METPNRDILNSFTLDNIPNLDVAVLGALELFMEEKPPHINLDMYKRPMVVGSGNAEATGRIIFEDKDAIFASESSYKEKFKNIDSIDGVILVSASGGKHAPIIAKCAQKYGKHVTLITNTENSPAHGELDLKHPHDEFVLPKNREPYTYNTSTYMGMILGHTGENPKEIYDYIQNTIDTQALPDFSRYEKFYLIVPARFASIKRLLQVKFIELFGRKIARDVETNEYVRHATTVVQSEELFISFGYENKGWGKLENRLNIPLPKEADYGAMMAIGYYIIGKIQSAHPPYFKENIAQYAEDISKVFGNTVTPIVE